MASLIRQAIPRINFKPACRAASASAYYSRLASPSVKMQAIRFNNYNHNHTQRRFNTTEAEELMDIREFHERSDAALEHILEEYENVADTIPEIDVELAVSFSYLFTLLKYDHGILTINVARCFDT